MSSAINIIKICAIYVFNLHYLVSTNCDICYIFYNTSSLFPNTIGHTKQGYAEWSVLDLIYAYSKQFHSWKSVDQSINTNGKYHVTCDHKIFKTKIFLTQPYPIPLSFSKQFHMLFSSGLQYASRHLRNQSNSEEVFVYYYSRHITFKRF